MNKSLKVTSFGGPKKPPNLGEVMFNILGIKAQLGHKKGQ